MTDAQCRWGIVGTATIAQKNWKSIWNAANATLSAVASRDVSRSQQFIDACQGQVPFAPVPRALGSYEELLASDDIDAVYIPLPTGIRKEWVLRAAEAGKHVMCEKPCGVDEASLVEMLDACRRNNVQFMDGVMFSHSKRLDKIREVFDNGESIGTFRRIASQFSFCADDQWLRGNIRTTSGLEPHGCLGDLGWYNIRFALWAMNWSMPKWVSGRILKQLGGAESDSPVPVEFSGEMFFDGDVSASFYCSFITEHQQWVNVSGTKGNLQLNDFVLPYFGSSVTFDVNNAVFDLAGCDFNMERHVQQIEANEYSSGHPNAQETNLFRTFSELALSGHPDPFWGDIALKTQQVMEACLQSARDGGQDVKL